MNVLLEDFTRDELNEIVTALEKQEAKPLKYTGVKSFEKCPSCRSGVLYPSKYCGYCGQRVKWNVEVKYD